MSTSFELPYLAFFKKIEENPDFFDYYNLSADEALELAKERASTYLKEAITKLTLKCTPDVNFHDYDDELAVFNFDCVPNEINIIGGLMFEMYLEKDIGKLRVHATYLTSQDLNVLHSPANERKTFYEMFNMIVSSNETLISNYAARDRITGKRKKLNHASYQ